MDQIFLKRARLYVDIIELVSTLHNRAFYLLIVSIQTTILKNDQLLTKIFCRLSSMTTEMNILFK